MTTLVAVVVAVAIAALVGTTWRARRRTEPPTQQPYTVPQQLDRADFAQPSAPWLVAVFASETCHSCSGVIAKAEVLRSHSVTVDVVTYQQQRELHERYGIDAVPTTVVADRDGVVQRHFIGAVTATDLWAAVAELREPGSTPPPEAHVRRAPEGRTPEGRAPEGHTHVGGARGEDAPA